MGVSAGGVQLYKGDAPRASSIEGSRSIGGPGNYNTRLCKCDVESASDTHENGIGVVEMRSRPVKESTSWFKLFNKTAVNSSELGVDGDSVKGLTGRRRWDYIAVLECGHVRALLLGERFDQCEGERDTYKV